MADPSQRTEKPTQRRLKKAREEGRFLVSKEFVGGFQFLAIVLILATWSGPSFERLQETFGELLLRSFQPDFGPGELVQLLGTGLRRVFDPLLGAGVLLGAITLGLQLLVT